MGLDRGEGAFVPRECGLEADAVVSVIVLPPLYGALGRAGIAAPGEAGADQSGILLAFPRRGSWNESWNLQVMAAKMELHDALAQAGKLTPIHS